jgi:hypothetical protein
MFNLLKNKGEVMKLSVQSGYLTSDGFTTRSNDYMDTADLPSDAIATEEEKEAYAEGDNEVYRTADGKIFLDYTKAKAYQETLELPELNEVLEALEKVKVLCTLYKDKSPIFDTITDAVNQLQSDGGEELMDKYYDSTCW